MNFEINKSFNKFTENRRLMYSIFSGSVLTFLTHAYSFFNSSFTNDRMSFFREPELNTAISGKWFAQFYSYLHAYSYLPWFEGILMMLFISISVYATIEVLRIKEKLSVWIIAGLYTTNLSVIAGNFYGGDAFVFPLMMATLSAWIWSFGEENVKGSASMIIRDHYIVRVILSALSISICLGIYGSYASVGPTLVIIASIGKLVHNDDFNRIIKRGTEYVLSFALGMVIYYLILRAFLKVQNLQMQSYMGEDRLVKGATVTELIGFVGLAYKNSIKNWMGMVNDGYSPMPNWISIGIVFISIILLVILLIQYDWEYKCLKKWFLLFFLLGVFPLSAGLIYIMAFGRVHYLMEFSFVIYYVGIVKLTEMIFFYDKKNETEVKSVVRTNTIGKLLSNTILIIFIITIFSGMLNSNIAYNALQKSTTSSISIATRLIDRIESYEGTKGNEMIVFVGDLCDNNYVRMPKNEGWYWKGKISGLGTAAYSTSFAYYGNTRSFMREVMGFYRDISYYRLGSLEGGYSVEDEITMAEMPIFPADGSIKIINGNIVVKLSDIQ